jgi:hypothetical protein
VGSGVVGMERLCDEISPAAGFLVLLKLERRANNSMAEEDSSTSRERWKLLTVSNDAGKWLSEVNPILAIPL